MFISQASRMDAGMAEENRPNPEELLQAISQEEKRKLKGCLKIFLGMAAGVGKTYAMLEEALQLNRKGVHVVVGVIETHGRQETASRLEGLKIIPRKQVEYKGNAFEEMDLDEILRQKPELVLVDELAHSNVPGSRHPKRWQDVVEILDNGIDVFTTLNVQHIESLKDVVENIAGIAIRETVPDRIIEAATFIELVDITTGELLQRLKDGKVYLGDKSELAAQHFFQEDRLTALREIVLRFAAEKIDHDLHGMVSTAQRELGWKPRERFLVALSHSPHSQRLIRTTRRLAFNMDAPWIAVHVDDGRVLDEEDKEMLAKNIALARDLGAEVITTTDTDIAQGLARVARHRGVTQIIIGRPPKRALVDFLPSYTMLDNLARECTGIDIHVIRQSLLSNQNGGKWHLQLFPKDWLPYLTILALAAGLSLLNWFLIPYISYKIVGFIFLLGILSASLFYRAGPIFFASILYAIIWDTFFIPSAGMFTEDHVFLLLYLLTGILTGILTDRAKKNKAVLIRREESARTLYEIAREIAGFPLKEVLPKVEDKLSTVLNGKCHILLKTMDSGLAFDSGFAKNLDMKEQMAALWVFENNKEAGWSTSTLPSTSNLYLPLKGFNEMAGVLCYHPLSDHALTLEEKNFLYTVGQLLANSVERSFLQEKQQKLQDYNKIEGIYQSILNMLSQQLEKPLDNIKAALKELKAASDEGVKRSESLSLIDQALEGLFRSLDNISAMAKLSSGLISLTKERNSISELIDTCCLVVKKQIKNHKLVVSIENDLPDLDFDFSLIELLVCNLIFNAIDNSTDNSIINIDARRHANTVVLSVSDQGKGIPEDMLDAVFEKFYRIPGTTSQGLGLGLSIGKTIAEIHGGFLRAENRPEGGAKLSLFLRVPPSL